MYVNPMSFAGAPAGGWSQDTVMYVMFKRDEARSRPTRVLTSALGPTGWKLDDVMRAYHAASGLFLGEYVITGISRVDNGARIGNVPDRLIKHARVQ